MGTYQERSTNRDSSGGQSRGSQNDIQGTRVQVTRPAGTTIIPQNLIGNRYTDPRGRSLKVIEVQPGDPLGREVIGRLKDGGGTYDYATSFKIFKAYFIDQIVPSDDNRKIW